MPQKTFEVTAPNGKTLEITGDRIPNEAELQEIFRTAGMTAAKTEPPTNNLGDFGRGVWNVVNPIEMAKGLVTTAASLTPLSYAISGKAPGQELAESVVGAQANLARKTGENIQKGDYLSAVRTGIDTALPMLGPALDASSEKIQAGKWAEGGGEVLTQAALLALGARKPSAARTVTKAPRMAGPANAMEASAVEFAKTEGIPLDLATATGNQRLRNLQKRVGNTVGGGATADALQTAQAENLARVGEAQAAKAAPVATNPVAAGEGVRSVLTKQVENLHQRAAGSYNALRAIEDAQRANLPKNPAVLATMDITARTPLAVDLTEAMRGLQPLYKQLKRESELGIPMQGAKGRTLAALDGLMNGPNVASLSVVDSALSDLKAMARGADMPELRTTGQATAAQAVQKLDAQVRAAAAKAGPNVLKLLEDGRAATKQKYATADVLDMLSPEPGQVFRQLTQAKDVGLERLKAVQRLAPKEMENIGRAFLEDALQQATSEGGFTHADRLWSNWQKLGGQSKQIMFPKKGQIQALDNFFLIAKKIKENPNPSGTATIPKLNFTELLAYFPAKGLAKILMTPASVKFLTDARVVSKGGSQAARAYALSNLTKAAQSAGVSLDAIPALAVETERDRRQ